MTTTGFYFRGLNNEQVATMRRRLNDLAAELGYVAWSGPTAGQGNLAAMLQAIDAGEVAVVLLSDEQRRQAARWLNEQAGQVSGPLGEALDTIAASLWRAMQFQAEANQNDEEDMMDEEITSIRYGFHAADLLGDFPGVEEYDVEANAAAYANAVQLKLQAEYPGAQVEVVYDLHASGVLGYGLRTEVNDWPDHPEIAVVEHLARDSRRGAPRRTRVPGF